MSAPSVRAVRPFRQPAVLVGRDPRDDEVLHLAGRVDGDDSAATGRGKRAGALDDLPQDDVEVEAPRCCAERPQSVARYGSATSPSDSPPSDPQRARRWPSHRPGSRFAIAFPR